MSGLPASNARSVVTGGAGFIGSHVVDALLGAGHDVHVVDDLSSGQRERVADGATLHVVDVADAAALAEMAASIGPTERWLHLAAQADVRVSVADPAADARTNVVGTINVLEAARACGAPVTFASTGGAIYGPDEIPASERSREAPVSPYGAAKLAAEVYVAQHARLHGLAHAIVRFANVYGPRQDPHGEAGVVAIFGGRVLAGEPATIFGDGRQTRDYVFVDDVVAATLAAGGVAAARVEPADENAVEVPVWNVGTGIETSVLELWEQVQRAAGVAPGHELVTARAGELERSALDASLARRDLGVAFDTLLADGLRRTLDWMRAGTAR